MTDQAKSTFAKRVRAAKPRAKKYDVWDDMIVSLALRIGTSGRTRSATIGNADTMSVVETTERYVHLSDRSVADAADRVSGRIQAALAGRNEENAGGSADAHR